jgi:N-acetyl-anhydromuramyl-L-alanine amidase AmpD
MENTMPITIEKGRAYQSSAIGKVPVPFKASPNVGGALRPEFIVLHDTASGLNDGGPISWLTNPASKVSAHVVIGRDGKITQLVPFDVKAWHAGQSVWNGRPLLNGFSIGIEIVNPGKLQKVADGVYKGVGVYDTNKDPSLKIERMKTNAHGDGYWLAYSDAQVRAVTDLCKALAAVYPISEILTHWLISPGRKVDTNPLFPLNQVREAVKLSRPIAKPMAIADLTGGEDEKAGDAEITYQGNDYHAPVGTPDTDESDGGSVGFFRRGWNWVTSLFAGGSLASLGAFTKWEIALVAFGGLVFVVLLAFVIALWLFGKQNVGAWIARKIG